MQEERTAGPHSYLAGYVLLAIGAVPAILVIVVAAARGFWGDRPMERCEVKLDRVAQAVHKHYRDNDGKLPERLKETFPAEEIQCPLCRDDDMGSAVYRLKILDKETFALECRYEAHRMIGGLFPAERFRTSLTEKLQKLPKETPTPGK